MTKNATSTKLQLLHLLKQKSPEFYSGAALAAETGLTRSAIWKHMQNLKDQGYQIDSHPKRGYRLINAPDLLSPEEVLPVLPTLWLGKPYHYYPRIGSTNDRALELAGQGAPHGTVVVAEEQLTGRGRLGRNWLSTVRRGIYCSVILRDALPVHEAPQSTLVAALALARVLSNSYHLPAAVKWPNDVLVRGRKVAGILTEMQSDQDLVRFLVLGIGINVNHSASEMTGPFRYPATSLAIELAHPIARADFLAKLLAGLEKDYDRFRLNGFAALLPELENLSATLGKTVQTIFREQPLSGRAIGLTPEGALRLQLKSGEERVIWVGDVTHIEEVDS